MTRLIPYLTTAMLLTTVGACDFMSKTNDYDSAQPDTTQLKADSATLADDVKVVVGVAIDGSRRNIYLLTDGDTLDFELSPDMDVEWQIGDTLTVRMMATAEGDSIVSVDNATANSPSV